MEDWQVQRARNALYGLAIGDALGMPTQDLPRARAREILSGEGFVDAPSDQVIAAGMSAGTVTDDTEQAVLLARLLVEGRGHVDPTALAQALLAWEGAVAARGSLDLLGPSTRRALAAIAEGADPTTTGRTGNTNGAAMRITPVGIATPSDDLDALVAAVVAIDRPTHDTGAAHAGAAAVATVVSAGIDGAGLRSAVELATEAARRAGRKGYWTADADVASRITWATNLVRDAENRVGTAAALDDVVTLVGTSLATTESVPAAFAVATLFDDDPWGAALAAARLGGDADTIAAMTGAMVGATSKCPWPAAAVQTVTRVNDLALDELVAGLLDLRTSPQTGRP